MRSDNVLWKNLRGTVGTTVGAVPGPSVVAASVVTASVVASSVVAASVVAASVVTASVVAASVVAGTVVAGGAVVAPVMKQVTGGALHVDDGASNCMFVGHLGISIGVPL